MKIAQVAPLIERVPPLTYGGTERVVSFLTEELVRQGHEVTLFASGDSITAANLVPCCPQALRLDAGCNDPLAWHIVELQEVAHRAEDFDLIHFHIDYLHFPVSSLMRTPQVTTLHGRLDLNELPAVHRAFPRMPVTSISNAQRTPLPYLNWRATVYHGLPDRYLRCSSNGCGQHLTFLGRISPEKGVDRAIRIAIESGVPLTIAAKVDRVDREYFEQAIAPQLNHPLVHFIGEVSDHEKEELFGNTLALLFPIDWPEPFGLVMIEAMAFGVPIIAFRRGSVPEIVDHGITGYIVDNVSEAVAAVRSISSIDRHACRTSFFNRFRAARMADDYVKVYEQLIDDANPMSADLLLTGT
jgi:glycosyltransferase involved in cell wall biosynthesis